MRLGGMILENYQNSNNFKYVTEKVWNTGNPDKLCIQLVDLNKKIADCVENELFLRYMPESGASLNIILGNLDSEKRIKRAATQDSVDPSIWCIDIYPTDEITGSIIHLELTEGNNIFTGKINNAFIVVAEDNSICSYREIDSPYA